jgi:formylglycine-generating enzyme
LSERLCVALLLAAGLSWACSDDDRAAYCSGCYEQGGSGGVSSGAGGSGGSALASSGGAPQCQGVRGAPMVLATVTDGVAFCIDVREATITEWNVFLKTAGTRPAQPPPCDANDAWPDLGEDSLLPVSNTDWCDARAFCAWQNKRLCGRIADGSEITTEAEAMNPLVDEWLFACTSGGGAWAYPYGDTFDETICNTHLTSNAIDPVLSHPDCHGVGEPYASIFDMSGNLAEWTSWCDPDPSLAEKDQLCHLRGGDWTKPNREEAGKCRYFEPKQRLELQSSIMGIRCCKDASAASDGGAG